MIKRMVLVTALWLSVGCGSVFQGGKDEGAKKEATDPKTSSAEQLPPDNSENAEAKCDVSKWSLPEVDEDLCSEPKPGADYLCIKDYNFCPPGVQCNSKENKPEWMTKEQSCQEALRRESI